MVKTKKLALLQHVGGGNVGDDATLQAIIQNILVRWPNAALFAFSMNPYDTRLKHGIPSYPISRHTWGSERNPKTNLTIRQRFTSALTRSLPFLRSIKTAIRVPVGLIEEVLFLINSFRIIRSFDVLLVCGGGQLTDLWGGSWAFPYTLFKWVFLAKLARVKTYFIDVGAGPIKYPLSKRLVRRALTMAAYTSFRDEASGRLVKQLGFKGRTQVFVDAAYGLDVSNRNSQRGTGHAQPIVGFSPMAYCDPRVYWDRDQVAYSNFIDTLAGFASWLIHHHHTLALFSTDVYFDAPTIAEFPSAVRKHGAVSSSQLVTLEPMAQPMQVLSQMSSMDYIVTCRFHGVVFAHLMNIPVLAISHHSKVATLMNDLGLGDYCIDIRSMNLALLANAFSGMVNDRDAIKAQMSEKLSLYQRKIAMQLDALLPRESLSSMPSERLLPNDV